ncbi:MAG: sdhA [Nitrospirae bacterium]|nr:sdhA [Nitrospirota bacterium]
MILDGKIPTGPLPEKWDKHKQEMKLVSPANKRKYRIIVVGTGLAGASAAATLGELGYNVDAFCFQDTPRRGHSIAAQGGVNAAKNYPSDGDSIWRLLTTAPSAAPRSRAPSMPAARPASSSFSAPMAASCARSRREASGSTRAPRCWTWCS